MDKIEKIRKEIERLRAELYEPDFEPHTCDFVAGVAMAYNGILDFIDAIEEGSTSADLEEAL